MKNKKILILGSNEWIYNKLTKRYSYSVISEKLTLLRIPLKLIPDLEEKAERMQEERIYRNKQSSEKVCLSTKTSQY